MSMVTVGSLQRMTAEQLRNILLTTPKPPIAIIDVRDADHIGGHILGSQHVPSSSLDYRAPELVRTLADTPTVVFHCALSQQRGPGAALRYLRERSRMGYDKTAADVVAEGGEQAQGAREKPQQQVYVLQGGFVKWQEKYGSDERLTEGYVKDIWEAF
ncbi:Rhodanese-like protein [Xylona heveae TC161]|uniref:Rhodanese-like protein n=1 Tax=Xylona heveae (strain CBS 132557 / TC161) TaxID=1328760 RepID=A0A165IV56_XYLHT|nr:Rhodanese-like protein [Xylona heveae TC161]KZF25433.1 Rhodanese-like protein [Xylona heveae TC161]